MSRRLRSAHITAVTITRNDLFDWDSAEAEAGLRAARTLFLQIAELDVLSEEMAETAGGLAATIQEHLSEAGPFSYRESEVRVGEARDMLATARRLVTDLRDRCGYGYETTMAEDAVYELQEHLTRLERADLELRTGTRSA